MEKIFSSDETWLQCIECGYKTDLLDERSFKCLNCGNLFDVMHSYPVVSFDMWTKVFDTRARERFQHGGNARRTSGVWRFHEWIMPYVPVDQIVTLGEGNVPIVKAGKHLQKWTGSQNLWMILEGVNPTGSFKDFGGTVQATVAKAAGIDLIGCASTGDTSAMAAAYAAAAGMKCVVILPQGLVTPAQIAQPLVHGAQVIMLPGNFDDCMRVVRELVEQGIIFPANSLNATRIEGHQASVFLAAQFFNWMLPDVIGVPVGNGSNGSSIGKGIRHMVNMGYEGPVSRILGTQSEAAHPLAGSWLKARDEGGHVDLGRWRQIYEPQSKLGETTATAAYIGDPVSWKKIVREVSYTGGIMNIAPEAMLNEAVGVCGKDGHFVCPQTGTILAGVKLAIEQGDILPDERVAIVSTATGLKFTESAAEGLMDTIMYADNCGADTVMKLIT